MLINFSGHACILTHIDRMPTHIKHRTQKCVTMRHVTFYPFTTTCFVELPTPTTPALYCIVTTCHPPLVRCFLPSLANHHSPLPFFRVSTYALLRKLGQIDHQIFGNTCRYINVSRYSLIGITKPVKLS
jgi:hypothetical protein